MDISVSQLNGRLASKLPPELPLGLVFVVGKVANVNGNQFVLKDGGHELLCQIDLDCDFEIGNEVRASGHLMFDADQLRYYLLARDVDVVAAEPLLGNTLGNSRELLAEGEGLLAALAAVKARAAVAPDGVAELPSWVKKLAPEEVQREALEPDEEKLANDVSSTVAKDGTLDEELVSMLSAAMDSEEELELTPELLAPYRAATLEPTVAGSGDDVLKGDQMDTAVPDSPTSYHPANREDTDWLVILLILTFFVLTIAIIVTIVLLIL
ncbi:MAG: hypothetical protein DHS20C20_30660 [Ardenticatenaceae bacterium]|nr:MAG: hypothetical protein DHS20C20_30660 [Ardenticatenaceae bacterium]